MNLQITPSHLSGSIAVPGSKSHTIRAIAFAMMVDGTAEIHAPLISQDTLSTLAAAELLGAKVRRGDDSVWTLTGTAGNLRIPSKPMDMGNSGTGIKLLAALVSTVPGTVVFDGDDSLRSRPMASLLNALEQAGVRTASRDGKCPFTLTGPFQGGRHVTVNGKSSQYVSAMILAAAFAKNGDTVLHVEDVNEKPYIGITLAWLKKLGLVCEAAPDYTEFHVPGGQAVHGFQSVIPADFSTAAFPLAAAAITRSEVDIQNLDFNDVQGDKAVFSMFEKMGTAIRRTPGTTHVSGEKLHGIELDLNACPDSLPALAAAAAFADGTTRLVHVAQARIKETDRIACMTAELRKMGVRVEELPDGMVIAGGPVHGAELESYGDHRIAMALTCAALGADSPSVIHGAECVSVTYPGFFRDFERLGALFTKEK